MIVQSALLQSFGDHFQGRSLVRAVPASNASSNATCGSNSSSGLSGGLPPARVASPGGLPPPWPARWRRFCCAGGAFWG
eukprot:13278630-Alexandrium_andersonii.AAC.1